MAGFDGATPLSDIVAQLDRLRATPDAGSTLLALLAEQSPVYAGRGSGEAERLRAVILARFETAGLPDAAIGFVIEELESGLNPYTVAAAACAMRGATNLPGHIVTLLLDAIERLRGSDDTVRFARDDAAPTTALGELVRTLAWLGPRAASARLPMQAMLAQWPPVFSAAIRSAIERAIVAVAQSAPAPSCCCGPAAPLTLPPVQTSETDMTGLDLQDQDGAALTFGAFFGGRPSVLTFFYTRCMNPNKCSLTITRLARLQERIAAAGLQAQVNVAAVTYDPEFDLPPRLHAYGAARGLRYDARNRLLRTTGPFEPLQRHFDLGVGYGAATVNQHRLDLAVLDAAGRPCVSFARVQWGEDEVMAALASHLVPASPRRTACATRPE